MAFNPTDLMQVIKSDNPTYERIVRSDLHDLVKMLSVLPLKAKPAEIVAEMNKIKEDKWKKYAQTRAYILRELTEVRRELTPKGVYCDIQFIGYCVASTGVRKAEDAKDASGRWYIRGDYLGTPADPDGRELQDVANRISIMDAAIKEAKSNPDIDPSPKCLKVFMSPEFFFRGPRGAYEMEDYAEAIQKLRTLAKQVDEHWVFAFGSVLGMSFDAADTVGKLLKGYEKNPDAMKQITEAQAALVKEFKKKNASQLPSFRVYDALAELVKAGKIPAPNPAVPMQFECYNVCLVQRGNRGEAESNAVVKEFKSGADFTGFTSGGLQPTNVALLDNVKHIPAYHKDDGKEVQIKNYDGRAVFPLAGITFGVEICLDHGWQRLKKSKAQVQVQLVPSCGMSLKDYSLAAIDGGYAFSCDGYGTSAHTSVWRIKDAKIDAVIAPIAKMPVASELAATHLGGANAGFLHIYPPLILPKKA